ncbi:formate dehydrogenase accessory sulfurtransferase FdhD [Kocuria sp.]|uniref:formate dehydrogenase accessory sulfurtransferase FdhD n=1 Tax=Kocuria sp. TaxID=1871328 RepID=UPI0026DFC76B|nr:formate dehydrogenase accessory sulfurtransferase FdhD [Kocuria sp.]MDO5617864.1 formate dehydrogenase accessory sulfurtransferase FdhD [Kocuria sp.]
MTRSTQRRRVQRVRSTSNGELRVEARADTLVGEEPLEIRLNGQAFAVTMRTPGHDFALAAGFLLSEGVITRHAQILRMDYRSGINSDGLRDYNVVDVQLEPELAARAEPGRREVYTSSSCGVCGTASMDGVLKVSPYEPLQDPLTVELPTILGLPEALRAQQRLFTATGGVHAAALFRMAPAQTPQDDDATAPAVVPHQVPELLCAREDVGRHNAVDKVVGWALENNLLPLTGTVLQVSARASFELVQKAVMAGIPVLSAVSAPSALAVDVADRTGLTLVGFNRGTGANIYAGAQRIDLDGSRITV